jgi:UDP:flavonoid glycosyltransferase YjiC (YdhE family)
VSYHGLGLVGDRSRSTVDGVDADLVHVLDDESIARRAASMAAHLRRYETDRDAVRAVERLLAHGPLIAP